MLPDFRPKSFVTGSTKSHIFSSSTISATLRLVWVFIIVWGELGIFCWSFTRCRWPSIDTTHSSKQTVKSIHVLLIGDTQVDHPTALRSVGYGFINVFRRVLFEINLRKNWYIASNLNPHAVIFLGDMLADGRKSRNAEEYDAAAQKFKSIFEINGDEKVHYIPGNEDIGMGSVSSGSKNLRSYYTKNFGSLNTKFVIANHTFIGLDAPGLVDEDYQRQATHVTFDDWKPISNGPISFVKEVSESHPSHAILLTHIPLSRPETADCGPLREKGGIRKGAGPGYQSMLGKQTTSYLLKTLEPLVIFSADNRDYCDYTHALPGGPQQYSRNPSNTFREVTVKSFSLSTHIRRPGFQLVSLVDPAKLNNLGAKSLADCPCLLPDQDKIYTSLYFPGFILTLLVIVILHFCGRRWKPLRNIPTLTSSPRSSGRNIPAMLVEVDPAQLSATWSPFSPFAPRSPRTTLPSYIRTPRSPSNSTTHLVASLPGSPAPAPSTLVVPMPYSEEDDGEDNDTMYAQYATRRDSYSLHQREDDEWSNIRDEEDYDMVDDPESITQSTLLSTSHKPEFSSVSSHSTYSTFSKNKESAWTYTFVLSGRRRRISLSFPAWSSLVNLLEFLGFSKETGFGDRRRQRSVPIAILSVLWPAIVMWIIINGAIL